jgi:excisionase family DNA binding protein
MIHKASDKAKSATRLLTVSDLCERLQLSKRTISRMVAAGDRLPRPVQIGRNVRWTESDIEEWIAQGCPQANDKAG